MRTTLLLAALTSVCFSRDWYGYIYLAIQVNDGSEVPTQRVLDELSNAVTARNRTAIADCLIDHFVWNAKGGDLYKEEFIDYLLKFSERTTPKGTIINVYDSSPELYANAELNFDGIYRTVKFEPKEGQEGKYVISWIAKHWFFQGYDKLEKKKQTAVDFLISLIKAISFKDRDAVLSHMTGNFSITACRGTYDRDYAATMYSSFREGRLIDVKIYNIEFINGEDVKITMETHEPENSQLRLRSPYNIDVYLKSLGGVYKMDLVEYHAPCAWQ
ncbi:unnamed protein product [Caenorhabditis nigoni]